MSRQNKVNPGMYTQRGRLTQDDAARELKQQRSIGSQHTWQPVQKDQMPRPRLSAKDNDADRDEAETSEDEDQAQSAKASASNKTTGKAKTSRSAKPAAKAATVKTTRKAVLARNAGGSGSKPRPAAKRRKS
jgi:hypothetical protein